MDGAKATKISVEKNRNSYIFSTILLSAAVALPHAILTPLLLSKGVSIAQIALIQMSYSICVFITEFPSGVLADRYSKKILFIISNFALVLFSLIVYTQEGVSWLILAWVFYGLSSAISSGTLDNDIVNNLKLIYANSPKILDQEISNFTRLTNRLTLLATLLSSMLGSFLYFRIDSGIYILSILLILFSTANIAIYYSPLHLHNNPVESSLLSHVSASFRELKRSASIKRFALFIIISQIFFQAHFQFWQSFALEKGIAEESFYLLYALFQVIGILTGYVPVHKLSGNMIFKMSAISLVISLPLLWSMAVLESYYAIIPYSIFVAEFWVLVSYCNYALRRQVSTGNISSITSLLSSISRIGAIISLTALAYLISSFGLLTALTTLFLMANFLVFLISIRIDKNNYANGN